MTSSVAVIDYGMGNLHSIAKALQIAGPDSTIQIVSDSASIMNADRVVFPGVGAIRDCMFALNESGLADVVRAVIGTKPVLGICLGMQALLTESEENDDTQCLDVYPGQVLHFSQNRHDNQTQKLKIPHMGWNQVQQSFQHPMWEAIPQNSWFYFVHSYYASPSNRSLVAATAEYPDAFCCALAHNNTFAVQFHPEKSQAFGLQLLKNFLRWDGSM